MLKESFSYYANRLFHAFSICERLRSTVSYLVDDTYIFLSPKFEVFANAPFHFHGGERESRGSEDEISPCIFQGNRWHHVMWRFFWYISLFRCGNEPSTYWRVPCQQFHWQVEIQICSRNIVLGKVNSVGELQITFWGAPVNTDFEYFLIFCYSFFEDFKTVEFRHKTMSWNICWT